MREHHRDKTVSAAAVVLTLAEDLLEQAQRFASFMQPDNYYTYGL